jgi:16S rRNA A1518/A1519 N6-dimethyltransferase RsmA/KsgA/DIM1 with predicted DNA glycosylase/AP lyase activity
MRRKRHDAPTFFPEPEIEARIVTKDRRKSEREDYSHQVADEVALAIARAFMKHRRRQVRESSDEH